MEDPGEVVVGHSVVNARLELEDFRVLAVDEPHSCKDSRSSITRVFEVEIIRIIDAVAIVVLPERIILRDPPARLSGPSVRLPSLAG